MVKGGGGTSFFSEPKGENQNFLRVQEERTKLFSNFFCAIPSKIVYVRGNVLFPGGDRNFLMFAKGGTRKNW